MAKAKPPRDGLHHYRARKGDCDSCVPGAGGATEIRSRPPYSGTAHSLSLKSERISKVPRVPDFESRHHLTGNNRFEVRAYAEPKKYCICTIILKRLVGAQGLEPWTR